MHLSCSTHEAIHGFHRWRQRTHHGCTLREEADKAFEFGYEMQRRIDEIGSQLEAGQGNTDVLVEQQAELIQKSIDLADAETQMKAVKELAEMIAKIGGKKVEIVAPSNMESKGYNIVSNSIFSTDRLESLGWSVTGSMEEKLRKTILFERVRYGRNKSL